MLQLTEKVITTPSTEPPSLSFYNLAGEEFKVSVPNSTEATDKDDKSGKSAVTVAQWKTALAKVANVPVSLIGILRDTQKNEAESQSGLESGETRHETRHETGHETENIVIDNDNKNHNICVECHYRFKLTDLPDVMKAPCAFFTKIASRGCTCNTKQALNIWTASIR